MAHQPLRIFLDAVADVMYSSLFVGLLSRRLLDCDCDCDCDCDLLMMLLRLLMRSFSDADADAVAVAVVVWWRYDCWE